MKFKIYLGYILTVEHGTLVIRNGCIVAKRLAVGRKENFLRRMISHVS